MLLMGVIKSCSKQKYTYFTADHPFMFVVMDKETGEILFLGRFMG